MLALNKEATMNAINISVKKVALLAAITSTLLLSGCGITAKRLHDHAGYADIESPSWWQADNELNLSLGPTTIRAARWFTSIDKDPDIKALLKDVKGVRISVYNIEDNNKLFGEMIAETQTNLNADGWHPVIRVNEKESHETMLMFMKSDGDIIDGLVVLTLDDDEAVFVNVIGNIRPESFEPLMAEVYHKE
jgi:hypothetical protein